MRKIMQYLTEEQVRQRLKPDQLMQALRSAFARDFKETLRMPVRTHMELSGSLLLLMPCYDSGLNAAGVKMVTVSKEAGVNAIYTLLDPQTGEALAVMQANYLTDVRTAAISALATDLLARPDVQTLGIFGTGRQAIAHVKVLPHVRGFRRILVCGSARGDVQSFCDRIKAEQGMEAIPADAETCARHSDVICTCTTSSTPLFDGRCLRAGAHLNLVGTFQPHTREVDEETVKRARIVVDTYEGALAEAGDLLIPMQAGIIDRSHILADLHEIASGKKMVRTGADDITLFKSVGCALEDLVAAKLALSPV